jgi:sugar phosphate isomerase/epimerase
MRRIGIAVWNFEGEHLGPKLRMFAEMGYTAASINNSLMDTLSADDEAEATDIAEEYDLQLTVHGGLIRPGEPVDEHLVMSRAERTLRWHERTGRIVCTSYDVPSVQVREGVKRKDPAPILDITRELLDLFAGSGVRVLLEDCPLDLEAARLFEGWTVEYPHLGMLADLGHMNIRLREHESDRPLQPGAVETYLKAIPWEIVELHVHSNDGSRDQHAPPYAPNADLPTAAKVLREIGFDGVSTIELVPAWCGMPAEEIMPACRRSLEYWRNLLGSGV